MWKLVLALVLAGTFLGCDSRAPHSGNTNATQTSTKKVEAAHVATQESIYQPVIPPGLSVQKTIGYWRAVHHSANIVVAFTDPNIILFTDGTELDQFQTFIVALRSREAVLASLPTAGVHLDIMEWNLKACLLLELQAMELQKYDAFFKRYVNPFGSGVLAADSLLEFLHRTANGDSPQAAAAKSLLSTALSSIDDIGNASDAVYKVTREVVQEKYRVRARVSNQLGIDLPLDDDGCPIIRLIMPGSPAAAAGILPGDICITYDGKGLAAESSSVDSLKAAREAAASKPLTVLIVLRNGEEKSLRIPTGLLGFEYTISPVNMPAPWDIRYFTKPKGWNDSYPYEKQQRKPWTK